MTAQLFSFADADMLPADWRKATLLGRVETPEGPVPLLVKHGIAYDMSRAAPTVADLIERRAFDPSGGAALGDLGQLRFSVEPGDGLRLLSPIDLQCVKAAGVTFAVSTLERVIEEQAKGDPAAARAIRDRLETRIGGAIRTVTPGSAEAAELKALLIAEGMWSQYLEVAIGPDAEIFTKAPVLSTVGWGGDIGIRSDSHWNNPEPEIVLAAASDGTAVGATLGNDVNLRDFEGRSALLLGKAKDNNASCAIGPFIRLFDDSFSMDDVRRAEIEMHVTGEDGFHLTGHSSMAEISRDPANLLAQAMSEHQYPDGYVLFLGTLFAPTQDRDQPGGGFTHKVGDHVRISAPGLGTLINRVTTSKAAAPWVGGISALMHNLAARGLLQERARA